ncbi:MAG TPA: hypothetical protein VGA01_04690, partial [Candidatus Binatia bacterium]
MNSPIVIASDNEPYVTDKREVAGYGSFTPILHRCRIAQVRVLVGQSLFYRLRIRLRIVFERFEMRDLMRIQVINPHDPTAPSSVKPTGEPMAISY